MTVAQTYIMLSGGVVTTMLLDNSIRAFGRGPDRAKVFRSADYAVATTNTTYVGQAVHVVGFSNKEKYWIVKVSRGFGCHQRRASNAAHVTRRRQLRGASLCIARSTTLK
jgi:hypothetical protein